MFGDRLSVVKRCAVGGGVGFVVATLLVPVIGIVAVSGFSDFPDSALHAGTILFFVLLGAVASAGLAVALRDPVRRVAILVRGGLGFGVAGVLMVASGDGGGIGLVTLAGAIVGLALSSGTPIGVPIGALVGGSMFSVVAVVTSALEDHPLPGAVAFLRNPPGLCFADEKLPLGMDVLGVADFDGDGDGDGPTPPVSGRHTSPSSPPT